MPNMNLMAELSRARSFQQALEIARVAKLKKLGQGSSRIVYALDALRVLKVALNDEGVEQNEAESDICSSLVTTKVLDMHEEAYWVISERAQRLTNNASIFEELVGIPFGVFAQALVSHFGKGAFRISESDSNVLQHNPFFTRMITFIQTTGLALGDATKLTSFGVVGTKVVLLDYGLTGGGSIEDLF